MLRCCMACNGCDVLYIHLCVCAMQDILAEVASSGTAAEARGRRWCILRRLVRNGCDGEEGREGGLLCTALLCG
jgi:hypothetical protein